MGSLFFGDKQEQATVDCSGEARNYFIILCLSCTVRLSLSEIWVIAIDWRFSNLPALQIEEQTEQQSHLYNMASSVEAPQQYKQPSRKGKRAWRKNVNVSEIQEGLDTVRDEVIQGGVIAEKSSETLFTLDTTGSAAIQKAYNKVHKPLKSDQILAQRSAVPAVDGRKRSGVTDGVVEPSSKRRKGNGLSHKEYERLKNIAFGGETVQKDVIKADGTPAHDPWEDVAEQQDPRFSYLEKPKKVRAPRTLQEGPISLVAGAKRIPAVKKPNAGISYNPSFQDWDQLLTEEGAKEVEAEKKRLKDAEEERVRLEKIAAAQDERDDIQMEDESAWEGFESEYEGEECLTKRRPERKTPAERNRLKRRKEAERQAKWDAQMKKRAQQALQIKSIVQQVEARERARAVAKVQAGNSSSDEIDDRVLRRRKLGKAS